MLTVVELLTDDELVSASTKLVSSPERPRLLSTCTELKEKQQQSF